MSLIIKQKIQYGKHIVAVPIINIKTAPTYSEELPVKQPFLTSGPGTRRAGLYDYYSNIHDNITVLLSTVQYVSRLHNINRENQRFQIYNDFLKQLF